MKRPERDDLMNELKIGCVGSVHMTFKHLLQHFYIDLQDKISHYLF